MRQRADGPPSAVGLWLLAALLVLGGIAAAMAYVAERGAANERDELAVDLASTHLVSALQRTTGALGGADGLVVDGSITSAEFTGFARGALQGSLFPTIAYVSIVRDDALAEFEAQTGLDVRDTDGQGGFVDAAPRPEHLVVRYVHPATPETERLLGFDIASDPRRASAAARSSASRAPAMVRLDTLAGSRRPGLFAAQAVFASHGTVVGYLSGGVNFDEVLAVTAEGSAPAVGVSVYVDGVLVAGSGASGATRTYEIGGVTIDVEVDDPDDVRWELPVLVLLGTVLMALGVGLTARRDRRFRVQREEVTERNRALAELGQRLAAAVGPEDLVDELLRSAGPVLGATRVWVGRRTDVDPNLVLVRTLGGDDTVPGAASVHRLDEDGPLIASIRTGEAVRERDFAAGRALVAASAGAPAISRPADAARPVVSVPFRFQSGYCVGAVGLEWSGARGAVVDDLSSAVTTFAELAARAIERAVITQVVQTGAARLSGLARALASAATSTDVARVVESMVPTIIGSAYALVGGPIGASGTMAAASTSRSTARSTAGGAAVVDTFDQVVRDGAGVELATIRFGWTTAAARTPTLHAVLETIAELVGLTLARTGLYDQEHELITQLQTALLPPAADVEGLEIVVRYQPASPAVGIGGDWYDVLSTEDGTCFAMIGDVSGHGAAAVTTMAQLKAVISHLLAVHTPVDEVYAHADAVLVQQDTQATAQIVVIDVEGGTLRAASAGHPVALVRRVDGTVEQIGGAHRPLLGIVGMGSGETPAEATVPFAPGDVLLMYTDGLIERRRTPLDVQIERLGVALAAAVDPSRPLADAVQRVLDVVLAPTDDDVAIDDDRAVIAIRRR